ncbi:Spo11/DNA topoisomerase VI subunit A [Trichoderma austrokoningii]
MDVIARDGERIVTHPGNTTSAGAVISRIESILESVMDCLAEGKELCIDLTADGDDQTIQRIRFPGKCAREASKFARILLILQLAHDALVSGIVLTKRHVFYQHQELFGSQNTVNELVDSLALALGVRRDELNIVASSKGVFSGSLSIRLQDDRVIGPATGDAGITLPTTGSIAVISCEATRWILVVEKDAVFRSLTSSSFWQTSRVGPGIIITAKGYPDLLTCSFLQLIHFNYPQIPIFALVDYDPDGLNIFYCYRFKSNTAIQETDVMAPGIRWLGIRSQDLLEIEIYFNNATRQPSASQQLPSSQSSQESCSSKASISSTECRDPISSLSTRDRKVAVGVLEKLLDVKDDLEVVQIQLELQIMLMMGVKAEIQWLDEAGNLTDWLDFKLGQLLV